MSKFNDIKYMNDVIETDVLLVEYNKNKNYIVKLIENDPKKLINNVWKILNNDKYCMVNMNKENLLQDDVISCVHCDNLLEYVGDDLYDLFPLLEHYMMITATEVRNAYLRQVSGNKIKGDNFTVKVLTTFYIEHLFKNAKIPHALNMITSYRCNNVGYSLYSMPTVKGELFALSSLVDTLYPEDPLKLNDIMYGILIQLIVIFNELQKINFSFGNPSINAFLFSDKVCKYEYAGFLIECDYTMVLSDLSKSSMVVNNVLYFPECNKVNGVINNNFMTNNFTVKDKQYVIHEYLLDGVMNYTKYNLPSSADFYLTIVSLAQDPIVYDIIMNNEKCHKVRDLIWSQQIIDLNDPLRNTQLHMNPSEYVFNNL
jgi:hypothetical protein